MAVCPSRPQAADSHVALHVSLPPPPACLPSPSKEEESVGVSRSPFALAAALSCCCRARKEEAKLNQAKLFNPLPRPRLPPPPTYFGGLVFPSCAPPPPLRSPPRSFIVSEFARSSCLSTLPAFWGKQGVKAEATDPWEKENSSGVWWSCSSRFPFPFRSWHVKLLLL